MRPDPTIEHGQAALDEEGAPATALLADQDARRCRLLDAVAATRVGAA